MPNNVYTGIRPTDDTIYFNKILSKQRYLTFFYYFLYFFVLHMASPKRRIPNYNASFFDAWYISELPKEFQILRMFRPEYLNYPLGNPEIYSSITKNACGILTVFIEKQKFAFSVLDAVLKRIWGSHLSGNMKIFSMPRKNGKGLLQT